MELLLSCLVIFFGRIVDVSLATLRTVFTVKGKPTIAAVISFAEATLWFLIVKDALTNTFEGVGFYMIVLAYAAGFAMGTFVGGHVSKVFIKSKLQVQVITSRKNDKLVKLIRDSGYAVTVVNANSSEYGDKKYMLFVELVNTDLPHFKDLVKSCDDKAFIMVHESKAVFNGYFINRK